MLLNPSPRRKLLRTYTTLGCPMAHGRATWCRGLCEPIDGYGVCGRLAPHAMKGRTQLAIAADNAKRAG
jgi:hypothetical protein